jgi:hypothetical protein
VHSPPFARAVENLLNKAPGSSTKKLLFASKIKRTDSQLTVAPIGGDLISWKLKLEKLRFN